MSVGWGVGGGVNVVLRGLWIPAFAGMTGSDCHREMRAGKLHSKDISDREAMKNVTVSVDDETHRRLRIMAAEQGTSVSAMIRDHMLNVINGSVRGNTGETEPDRRRRRLAEITEEFQNRGAGTSMRDNLTREEMYEGRAPR